MPAEPALTADSALASPDSPAPADFRRAMAEFATGVTVVTALDGGEPVGFACQSFASVSLEPPLVLFCADRRGRSWARIRAAGRFCVHVLGEDQRDLCERFGSSRGLKFEGLGWDVSPWGTPELRGVLLGVHALVQDVHRAGDHDVVIGRVLAIRRPDAEPGGTGRLPMIFFRSRFGLGAAPGDAGRNTAGGTADGTAHAPVFPGPWDGDDRWGWG